MRARDLAELYPFVTTDDDAVDAARMLAEQSLPALLVLDADGQPYAIVPGSQLIRQLIPAYIAEDPALAGVVGEQHDGELAERLAGLTVAEWAPRHLYPPPVVGPGARPMEVADLMARTRSGRRHRTRRHPGDTARHRHRRPPHAALHRGGGVNDASILPVAIVTAALVIRTAISEIHRPGSARRQWAFMRDRRALAAGAVTAATTVLVGWPQAGPAAVAWALLIGTLTAHLVHQAAPRSRSTRKPPTQ
ncbi:CBS domain-containing protein [Streptomyces sp. NPDC000410]|uniref:CBS domain-containing protein n=1 Tax=Streptomyces sp. NPDC000410 TaxID=3154254 RepID=UPI003326DE2C